MKFYSLIVAFLFSVQAGAAGPSQNTKAEGRVPECQDGSCRNNQQKVTSIEDLREFSQNLGLHKITATANASQMIEAMPAGKAAQCSKFVEDSKLSTWGKVMSQDFDKGKYQALYSGPKDLVRLCPKYGEMTDSDKDALWALFGTMWVFYESSCKSSAKLGQARGGRHGAPNGVANGILQLHKGKEARYSPGNCKNGDSSDPVRSLRCGLSMLNDQIERGENLFSPRSYWSTLRPQNREIPADTGAPASLFMMKKICSLKACGAQAAECNKLIENYRVAAGGKKSSTRTVAASNKKAKPAKKPQKSAKSTKPAKRPSRVAQR